MTQSNGGKGINPGTSHANKPGGNANPGASKSNMPSGNVNPGVSGNPTANGGNNQNVSSTIQGAQRNRANEGLATANNGRTRNRANNSSSSGGGQGSQKVGQQNPENKMQAAKQAVQQQAAKQAIKKIALSAGIPEPVTERALRTKKGEKMLQTMIESKKNPHKAGKSLLKNAASALPGIPGLIGKAAAKMDDKKEEEKEQDKKEMQRQSEAASGDIKFEIDPSTLKKIVIFAPVACFMISFIVIIIALISNDKVSQVIVGQMSSKSDQQSLKDGHKQVKNDYGEYEISSSDIDRKSVV